MRKYILLSLLILMGTLSSSHGVATDGQHQLPNLVQLPFALQYSHAAQYEQLQISDVVSYPAYRKAVEGFLKLQHTATGVLTLIDFSRPSVQQRLVVIDMTEGKVLHRSLVAHGRNSGDMYATSFSNVASSYKSSLGFYRTGTTYDGSNGYSLRLIGLENGFNDHAEQRAIVIHGADYCNPAIAARGTRLGRSLGCPALPRELNRPIIDAIKGGSILFIYADNAEYLAKSPIVGDRATSLHHSTT